jgi:hypothetical protein
MGIRRISVNFIFTSGMDSPRDYLMTVSFKMIRTWFLRHKSHLTSFGVGYGKWGMELQNNLNLMNIFLKKQLVLNVNRKMNHIIFLVFMLCFSELGEKTY